MNGILARKQLKSVLNSNVLDPYPGTRSGAQFLDESDGINLNRPDTFPKGYVLNDERDFTDKSHFHTSGWSMEHQRILIHYFVKDKISYTDGSNTYTQRDYAAFMKEQIINTIQDNLSLGSDYYVENIEDIAEPIRELLSPKSTFHLYEAVIPVTVKWKRKYGT